MKNVCREKVDSVALIISYYNLGFFVNFYQGPGKVFWDTETELELNMRLKVNWKIKLFFISFGLPKHFTRLHMSRPLN